MSPQRAGDMKIAEFSLSSEDTLGEALTGMARALAQAGIENAQRDARFLLQGLLNIDGAQLLSKPSMRLGTAAAKVAQAIERRLAHEPVSRILGERAFYGRSFIVTPEVLDPRPETETVVDLALDLVRGNGLEDEHIRLADIGTGSGVLIATLLLALPRARGVATDVSPGALAVARRNAERLGVAERIEFVATRGLAGCDGPLHLIVSNPPYIPTREISGLGPEVRDFDPHVALDGGADGLDIYRDFASNIVNAQQFVDLVIEIGAGQASDVQRIFRERGWSTIGERKDLGGHVRAVALRLHR